MRKLLLAFAALLLFALPTLALGADALGALGLERRDVEHSLMTLLTHGEVWAPSPKKAVKAIAGKERTSLVRGLCEVAKAWTKTDDFKARYAQERQATLPKEPAPARDAVEVAAEEKANLEKALKDAEQAIAVLPPDQRGPAQQALEAARRQMLQSAPPAKDLQANEQERYRREKADYDRALAGAMPQDPKEGLRVRLKKLLELTDKVDFKAKLVADGGLQHFAAKDLEAKPREWKLCFRAGKEACEAARSFAQGWLAELK